MNKFIYCYDEDTRDKLIKLGFKLLKSSKQGYTFLNNTKILFENHNLKITYGNKITF